VSRTAAARGPGAGGTDVRTVGLDEVASAGDVPAASTHLSMHSVPQ